MGTCHPRRVPSHSASAVARIWHIWIVTAGFWPWLSGKCSQNISKCSPDRPGEDSPRNSPPLRPCSMTMPRALWWFLGRGGCFLCARYPCMKQRAQLTLCTLYLYHACQHIVYISRIYIYIYIYVSYITRDLILARSASERSGNNKKKRRVLPERQGQIMERHGQIMAWTV